MPSYTQKTLADFLVPRPANNDDASESDNADDASAGGSSSSPTLLSRESLQSIASSIQSTYATVHAEASASDNDHQLDDGFEDMDGLSLVSAHHIIMLCPWFM